jgi:predicted DNA-binding protein (UPF0251 family)
LGKPRVCRFSPDIVGANEFEPLNITMEEFESLRLSDYQSIQQKKSAEIMDISQSTFHRTLNSARKKISRALVEGRIIQIKGGDYIMDKKRYLCKNCGFEWQSASKEYDKCPDCDSENIELISVEADSQITTAQPGLGRRRVLLVGVWALEGELEWVLDLQEYVNAPSVVMKLQKLQESPVANQNALNVVFHFTVLIKPFFNGGIRNGINMHSESGSGRFKK